MFKTLVPDSLLGRFILILVLPSIILTFIASYFFYYRHWDSVNRNMLSSFVGEIVVVLDIIEQDNFDYQYVKYIANQLDFDINLYNQDQLPEYEHVKNLNNFRQYLDDRIANEFFVSYIDKARDRLRIDIILTSLDYPQRREDDVLSIITTSKRINNPTTYIYVMVISLAAIFMVIITMIFAKNQIRAITSLSQVMSIYGKNNILPIKFKPTGAKEVRIAGEIFLRMQSRIEEHVKQRTEMLAGISHDLRTPLTRIGLELALIEKDYDIKPMQNDINEMEHMINEYLIFAGGLGGNEKKIYAINLLLQEIIQQYNRQNLSIYLEIRDNCEALIDKQGINRCITNLIDNAFFYGDKVQITLYKKDTDCYIIVEDDGPGIETKELAKIFEPFYRIDKARNNANGSVGLGLSIAKNIIDNHNGAIKLLKSEDLGGLKVIICLPIA
ncbi:MAG: ATP-binding protein [Pseudomonadota bacterium]